VAIGLTYDELAALVVDTPTLPRYELHCCPNVLRWLRVLGEPVGTDFPYLGTAGLPGIEIFAEPGFEFGVWELRQDNEVIKNGRLWQ
jgi:hypothetical protein